MTLASVNLLFLRKPRDRKEGFVVSFCINLTLVDFPDEFNLCLLLVPTGMCEELKGWAGSVGKAGKEAGIPLDKAANKWGEEF